MRQNCSGIWIEKTFAALGAGLGEKQREGLQTDAIAAEGGVGEEDRVVADRALGAVLLGDSVGLAAHDYAAAADQYAVGRSVQKHRLSNGVADIEETCQRTPTQEKEHESGHRYPRVAVEDSGSGENCYGHGCGHDRPAAIAPPQPVQHLLPR